MVVFDPLKKYDKTKIKSVKIHEDFVTIKEDWTRKEWWIPKFTNDMAIEQIALDFFNDNVNKVKTDYQIESINRRIIKKLKLFNNKGYIHNSPRGIPPL